MKTRLIVLVGIICLAFSAQAIEKKMCSGKTFSDLGTYEVFKDVENSNDKFNTYILKYENCEECFTIMVCKGDDCKNYVIYGNNLELQYKVKKNKIFGMTKLDKKYRKLDKEIVAQRIDREQLFRQKVISTSPNSEKGYLGLIACYLPQVIK